MGYHLSQRTVPGLERVKYFPGNGHSVGALVANQHSKNILDACFAYGVNGGVRRYNMNSSITEIGKANIEEVRLCPPP